MSRVILERSGPESWIVRVGRDGDFEAAAVWDDLAFAAYSAISLAGLIDAGAPLLGEGVPADALAEGERLRHSLSVARLH